MKMILLYTTFIVVIIFVIIGLCYNEDIEEREVQTEEKEEREQYYLKLQNMTTNEILLFKNKKEFIRDVGCYDMLREFYNDEQIIKKVYPNYKRLD